MPRKKATKRVTESKLGRAANGMGSLRSKTVKGKTYWVGRYSAKDPLTGKSKQHSVFGKTEAEAHEKLVKAQAEISTGTYIAPSKQTLGEWLDFWLEVSVKHSVKPYTLDSYRSACENHIKPSLGNVKLMDLTPTQLEYFYNVVLLEGKGLSPKTIKNIHGTLHKALSKAVKNRSIHQNPADFCDLPKAYKKEITPLEQDDVGRLLEAIQGSPFELLYQVTLFTGMRQGEVLGLTWDCVDFEQNTLLINKQLQKSQKVGGTYQLVSTKNGKGRLIRAAASVMTILKEQQRRQREMQMLAGPSWNNDSNLVFTNQTGGHLAHTTVYKHFKKIVGGLNLKHTRFHDLRHSYAVAALESGVDYKTLQKNLGHATVAFTMDIYAHVSSQMGQKAADCMEGYIQHVSGKKT